MAQTEPAAQALPTLSRQEGRYRNLKPMRPASVMRTLRIFWDMVFNKPRNTRPAGRIPVQPLSRQQLLAAPDNTVYRLGHSTILLKLRNRYWLTDPVFSERASPVSWAGPQRFHQPPIALADLPPLAGVILSHNHYDHLDHAAILQLKDKAECFFAPLGVGDTLVEWGVPREKVRQLDWWQSTELHGVRLSAASSQHFSGRSLRDSNATLWCSWVIDSGQRRIFFSGDSGYHAGFKLIGERFGPFDLTLMETGAYNSQWSDVHMHPEQSLQAHLDVRGDWMLPIHNGTFDLAMHAWHEPFDRILELAWARSVPIATPEMGQPFYLDYPNRGEAWWLTVDQPEQEQAPERHAARVGKCTDGRRCGRQWAWK